MNFSWRERDGFVRDIGGGEDIDGLGTENIAVQLKWQPTDDFTSTCAKTGWRLTAPSVALTVAAWSC